MGILVVVAEGDGEKIGFAGSVSLVVLLIELNGTISNLTHSFT